MANSDYHVPVLLRESVDALCVKPDGVYVDATLGGGSHTAGILKKINSKGSLYAFDQDEDALENAPVNESLILVHSNFRYVKNFMRFYGVKRIDGVLMDLGVSSYQFDSEDRGFAFRFDQELDMRMSVGLKLSAKDVLNTYSEAELLKMFSEYGEVRNSKQLSREIVRLRQQGVRFNGTAELNELLKRVRIGDHARYFAQVYQAIRIEVNDEMGALRVFLEDVCQFLGSGSVMSIISYHSLEDRLVKRFFKTGNVDGVVNKNEFGVIDRPFEVITKKPVVPRSEEMKINSRSRSAKLRVAKMK